MSQEKILSNACLWVDNCRVGLRGLIAEAKVRYKATLSDLESHGSGLADSSGPPLALRLESLRRSQNLHRAAGELDGGISRLDAALASLDFAMEALEGNATQAGARQASPSGSPLEAAAFQAQEEERYRLAREIHDGPAQILANVALQLEYISKLSTRDPSRVKDELANLQKDLRLAVGEVRRFMYDLRPPALEQQGVGPAVESHCQRLAERFGLQIVVQWETSATLSSPQDTALFRIVQEALQNVVKHAQATHVQVRAREMGGFLEVSVGDNGKGFESDQLHPIDPNRFGLAGMRARAQQIGATLLVSSVPRQGTTITLRLPLSG